MRSSIILLFVNLLSYTSNSQGNVFGHYETPTVSAQYLHLRPDSTYVLYYVSDIGARTKYQDVTPKPFKVLNGEIHLINETTNFDSIFVLTDSLNLVPKNNPNSLIKRVFYHDDGTIKYVVTSFGQGYELRHYRHNSLVTIDKYIDHHQSGKHLEFYLMNEPLKSEWYQSVLEDGDTLNWNALTAFMDLNSEFHQTLKVEGSWLNGQKDGKWIYYTENGEIEKLEKYKLGELKTSR